MVRKRQCRFPPQRSCPLPKVGKSSRVFVPTYIPAFGMTMARRSMAVRANRRVGVDVYGRPDGHASACHRHSKCGYISRHKYSRTLPNFGEGTAALWRESALPLSYHASQNARRESRCDGRLSEGIERRTSVSLSIHRLLACPIAAFHEGSRPQAKKSS